MQSEKPNDWFLNWQTRVADQLADKNANYSPFLDDLSWYFHTFCTGYRPGVHDGRLFARPGHKPRVEPQEVAQWLGLCGDHPGGYFSVAPDNNTTWIILDIDKNSIYHHSISGEQYWSLYLRRRRNAG